MLKELSVQIVIGIASTVIVGLIVYFWPNIQPHALVIWTWICSVFLFFWELIVACWNWVFAPVQTWRCVFWITLIVSCWKVATWLFVRFTKKFLPFLHEPTAWDFMEWEKFGILWYWSYENGKITGLRGYCPNCKRIIRYSNRDHYNPDTFVYCSNCSAPKLKFRKYYSDVVNDVELEIEHAVRTGEWKNYVKRANKE